MQKFEGWKIKSYIGGGHDFMPLIYRSFKDLLVVQISLKLTKY